jgi:hypothetical protein
MSRGNKVTEKLTNVEEAGAEARILGLSVGLQSISNQVSGGEKSTVEVESTMVMVEGGPGYEENGECGR